MISTHLNPRSQLSNMRCAAVAMAVLAAAALAACGGGIAPAQPPPAARASALAHATDKLPIGLKDEPYSAQIDLTGGLPPYSHALVEGELPPGLALDPRTGEISGRPARSGEFSFTLSSRDSSETTSRQSYTLFIDESAGTASAAPGMPPRSGGPRINQLAVTSTGAPDLSSLQTIVSGMAEGEWRRVNLNQFSSVWTPAALRPLLGLSNPDPSKIILAWSSFAWDPNRAALLLYGGGHANYRGNDTYLWRASTQLWERASLPSAMIQTSKGFWNAIDGVDKAPASAHTYDNTIFLPLLDRLLVLGGAADSNGGPYLTETAAAATRYTGPYLFDPARAHPDKVGGSTGSHVKRVAPYAEVVGGNMWSNRESWLNASTQSTPPSEVLSNGCTGYAVENGRDTVYVRSAGRLFRYVINDLNNPAADTWTNVGRYYYGGSGGQSTCAYDPVRKIFVSSHVSHPFIFWNLATPGFDNRDTLVTPTDPSGEFPTLLSSGAIKLSRCAFEFDPIRNHFRLWCGDGRVWTLTAPPTASAAGWTIVKAPAPVGLVPTESLGSGILGKWKYIPNLDVFMGLADSVLGNIWLYKPVGWVNPTASSGNGSPSVSISAPAVGASFTVGAGIAISAAAADSDGRVDKVEFFANGVKIGQSVLAPFGMVWSGSLAGTHVLTAVATDDRGATTTSASRTITVSAPVGSGGGTVTLQRGVTAPTTVRDTYLSSYHQTLNFGASTGVLDQLGYYPSLLRFAIFQSEGGPVPNGARITSAVLSLYKYSFYDMTYRLHPLLQDWSESAATWNMRQSGVAWNVAGAGGIGTDYGAAADATASTDFNPGWVNFDLGASVQQMSLATPPTNFGWRLVGISGNISGLKKFYSSDFMTAPDLRPKLVITYE